MAQVQVEILEKINKYIDLILNRGIKIINVYLYGSYANNNFNEYSDIDLAIFSDNFTGIGVIDIDKISGISRQVDSRISALTLNRESFDSYFVKSEIIDKGIKII
jgi:predicted nucleotidyltransferase